MKKLIFTLLSAALFAPMVQAQDVIERADTRITVNRIRFGAYIAPNMSWMRPTAKKSDNGEFNVESDGSKFGFTYGLMAEYYFARNYGVVTGLQVNSTGGQINTTRANNNGSIMRPNEVQTTQFDYRLQYLEIPLALKLRTDDFNGFRFFGQLGLTLGINIGKKADYTVSYTDDSTVLRSVTDEKVKLTSEGTLKSAVAPIMLAMNIGAGAEYPINRKLTAYAGIFFNNGFTPDATNPQNFDNAKLGYRGDFYDAKTRLNNFALRIGLFF
jgi:opacity protein-like surface antigen